MTIPVIDLSQAWVAGSPASAAMATGFFHISNHGVSDELLASQFELTRVLMDLPLATRQALSVRNPASMRGFEALAKKTLDETARHELKECFYCGMAYPPDHPDGLADCQSGGLLSSFSTACSASASTTSLPLTFDL